MINVEKDNLADIEKNALAAYAVREGLFGPPANAEAAEARWQKCWYEARAEVMYAQRYEDGARGHTEEDLPDFQRLFSAFLPRRKGRDRAEKASMHFQQGNIKQRFGWYAEAIADYDQALRLAPNLAKGYTNRGVSKAELGQHTAAITDYDQALRLDPNDALSYYNRGKGKKSLRRHAEATADYDQALRIVPNWAAAYNNRGLTKENLGQYEASIADYDQALRLDSNRIEAYVN